MNELSETNYTETEKAEIKEMIREARELRDASIAKRDILLDEYESKKYEQDCSDIQDAIEEEENIIAEQHAELCFNQMQLSEQ